MSGQDAKHNEVRVTGTTGKGASPSDERRLFFINGKGEVQPARLAIFRHWKVTTPITKE